MFKELAIPRERRFYISSIFISWIMACFWLWFGEF
jgi:hypothetical protein